MPGNRIMPVGMGMTPATTELGRYIRKRRISLNLRQTELAQIVGSTQTVISSLETGKIKRARSQRLRLLASALQCDVRELSRRMMSHEPAPPTKLGKFVQAHRIKQGLSQAEFSRASGLGYNVLRSWEAGIVKGISYASARQLAPVLGVEVSSLVKFLAYERVPAKGSLGELVRAARRKLGMTGATLGRELGVTRQMVDHIEHGKVRFTQSPEMLKKVFALLGLDEEALKTLLVSAKRKMRASKAKYPSLLGSFVHSKRVKMKLTIQALAGRAGLCAGTIASIETGKSRHRRLHDGTVEGLSRGLQCEIPGDALVEWRNNAQSMRSR